MSEIAPIEPPAPHGAVAEGAADGGIRDLNDSPKTTEPGLIDRLRAPANWLRQNKGVRYEDVVSHYDRAPFEAAAEIERLRAALSEIATGHDAAGLKTDFPRERAQDALDGR